MTEILRRKLLKLVHGEEGVALVVTLALFMFLYVSCAGVYAVGRAVKDRIILQNAVDAAAYSAAVVQADYLSRIATINKAMAWNYAQFLKSQRIWIALRLMQEIDKYPTKTKNSGLTVSDSIKFVWDVDADVRSNLPADLKLKEKELEISKYWKELEDQKNALDDLIFGEEEGMKKKIRDTISTVLMANLPFRIGKLCRFLVKQPIPDDIFDVMDSGNEDQFLRRSGDGNNEDLIELNKRYWFQTTEGKGFQRLIGETSLRTSPEWLTWNPPYETPQPRLPIVDAHDFVSEIPHYAYITEPRTLREGYFPSEGDLAKGAITVAVAKWNENPWKELVADLTGIYAVFTHAEKNDWTFAIASAQAGYRNNTDMEARKEGRAYSLNGNDFDVVKLGKMEDADEYNGQDWDALYLPVRKAFANGDKFKDWLTENSGDNEWKELVDAGNRKYVTEPLEEIHFDELNHKALSRMHNNGGTDQVLKWNGDGVHEFLDLMYH